MVERTFRVREAESSSLSTPTILQQADSEVSFPRRSILPRLDQPSRPGVLVRLVCLAFMALLVFSTPPCACADASQPLRVGLVGYLKGVSTVEVSCSVDFTIADLKNHSTAMTSTYLEPVNVLLRQDGIEIKKADGRSVKVSDGVRIAPNKPGGLLTISAPTRSFSQYRGALEIRRITETGMLIVNEVKPEDYLMGVLPPEMPASFQIEALKAQAIAARTYAESSRGRHSASGFDLCDTVHCQVYLGSGGERPRTSNAVLETEGLVLRHAGELIWAAYSADCGGRTQNGTDLRTGRAAAYLKSVLDSDGPDQPDFCSTNKTHAWSKKYTPQELEAALNKTLNPPIQGLKTIAFCDYDESKRVTRVDIVDSNGSRTLTGTELRQRCGLSTLKSTRMIVCTTEDGQICFEGKGWGHGVGMCQWGAEGLAREPKKFSYEQILKHYYTGVEIGKLR